MPYSTNMYQQPPQYSNETYHQAPSHSFSRSDHGFDGEMPPIDFNPDPTQFVQQRMPTHAHTQINHSYDRKGDLFILVSMKLRST